MTNIVPSLIPTDSGCTTQAELITGLTKHAEKFADAVVNALSEGSSESDYYMLEAALQRGFEMIDDDGDVYVCSSRQIVELLKPYHQEVLNLRAKLAPNLEAL